MTSPGAAGHTKGPYRRFLSTRMRCWLADMANERTLSTRDTILAFIAEFGLEPEQAAELIIQWIRET